MKPFGDYIFEGHTMPGRQRYHLKYDGREQKPILTKVAKEKGVVIHNHVNRSIQDLANEKIIMRILRHFIFT